MKHERLFSFGTLVWVWWQKRKWIRGQVLAVRNGRPGGQFANDYSVRAGYVAIYLAPPEIGGCGGRYQIPLMQVALRIT